MDRRSRQTPKKSLATARRGRWSAFTAAAYCWTANAVTFAAGFAFVEPADWSVGDANTTSQEWVASTSVRFSATDTPPSTSNINPVLTNSPLMGVVNPGFAAGSGGYYAVSGDYGVFADIFNYGGPGGTRVLVQTAATLNTDFDLGVFTDTLELVQHDGASIEGGANIDLVQTTELFVGNVLTSFGIVPQQEFLFEFWLPNYTADFRVQFDSIVHSSFQHLRVDTLVVEADLSGDFDEDGDFDGMDFLYWQQDPQAADGDAGLDAWRQSYEGGGSLASLASVPEPSTAMLLVCAATGFYLTSRR